MSSKMVWRKNHVVGLIVFNLFHWNLPLSRSLKQTKESTDGSIFRFWWSLCIIHISRVQWFWRFPEDGEHQHLPGLLLVISFSVFIWMYMPAFLGMRYQHFTVYELFVDYRLAPGRFGLWLYTFSEGFRVSKLPMWYMFFQCWGTDLLESADIEALGCKKFFFVLILWGLEGMNGGIHPHMQALNLWVMMTNIHKTTASWVHFTFRGEMKCLERLAKISAKQLHIQSEVSVGQD